MNRAFYDEYWKHVIPDGDPTTRARKKLLASALVCLKAGSRVLDLGCGDGQFTSFLVSLGYEAMGVDVSPAAVDLARARHRGLRIMPLEDGGRIPAEETFFDAVWSSEVVEHVFDIHHHLSEINRVLRLDGLYILTTPYHGVVKDVLIALTKFSRHFDPEASHIRFFDKQGLKR